MKEVDVQRSILEYLTKKGYYCWRNNNGALYDAKLNGGSGGYRAQSKWTPKGIPDILLIHREEYGQLWGLEVKKPSGRTSPDQLLQQKRWRLNNAVYEIVKSLEDVKKLGL
jgi:hypothetical protein